MATISGGPKSGGGLEKLMSLASLAAGVYTGNPGMIAGGASGISKQNKEANQMTPLETSNASQINGVQPSGGGGLQSLSQLASLSSSMESNAGESTAPSAAPDSSMNRPLGQGFNTSNTLQGQSNSTWDDSNPMSRRLGMGWKKNQYGVN